MRTKSKSLLIITATLILYPSLLLAAQSWTITSPNSRLAVIVTQDTLGHPYLKQNNIYYRVTLDDKEVLPFAPLGFTMGPETGNFVSDLTFLTEKNATVNEVYSVITGKKNIHQDQCNEKSLTFKNVLGTSADFIFRAYDDGIALRYHIHGSGQATIAAERTAFRLPAGSVAWLQKFTANYEAYYDCMLSTKAKHGEFGFPALCQTPSNQWVLLTEAAVYGDYAGAHLLGCLKDPAIFLIQVPGRVRGNLPWSTPWRVAIIGDSLAPIVESVIVENLNPPCEIEDISWIKPGVSTFPWWSDTSVNGKPERLRQFIDFAADMGWQWLEFDNALVGSTFESKQIWMTTDWVPDLIKYADSKGINVYGWDDWRNLDTPEKRAKILGLFNELGIRGIKVDFLNDDGQRRFKFRDDVILDCLRHKLMISFHGATIPRGQQRRWPHIMTWEGVIGSEYYQEWGKTPPTPQHNCTLPFTRNAVGPMDYTPLVFSATRKQTSNAHELALAVIFESGWQNIADKPESITASPAMSFLKNLPNTWDDIRFIDGYPAKFICLARRKAKDWFIAAINADTKRNLSIPLDFLKPGSYSVKLYTDSNTGDITAKDFILDSARPLRITLAPNAGFATKIPNSFE